MEKTNRITKRRLNNTILTIIGLMALNSSYNACSSGLSSSGGDSSAEGSGSGGSNAPVVGSSIIGGNSAIKFDQNYGSGGCQVINAETTSTAELLKTTDGFFLVFKYNMVHALVMKFHNDGQLNTSWAVQGALTDAFIRDRIGSSSSELIIKGIDKSGKIYVGHSEYKVCRMNTDFTQDSTWQSVSTTIPDFCVDTGIYGEIIEDDNGKIWNISYENTAKHVRSAQAYNQDGSGHMSLSFGFISALNSYGGFTLRPFIAHGKIFLPHSYVSAVNTINGRIKSLDFNSPYDTIDQTSKFNLPERRYLGSALLADGRIVAATNQLNDGYISVVDSNLVIDSQFNSGNPLKMTVGPEIPRISALADGGFLMSAGGEQVYRYSRTGELLGSTGLQGRAMYNTLNIGQSSFVIVTDNQKQPNSNRFRSLLCKLQTP